MEIHLEPDLNLIIIASSSIMFGLLNTSKLYYRSTYSTPSLDNIFINLSLKKKKKNS